MLILEICQPFHSVLHTCLRRPLGKQAAYFLFVPQQKSQAGLSKHVYVLRDGIALESTQQTLLCCAKKFSYEVLCCISRIRNYQCYIHSFISLRILNSKSCGQEVFIQKYINFTYINFILKVTICSSNHIIKAAIHAYNMHYYQT